MPKVEWVGADVAADDAGADLRRRRRGRPPRLGDPAEPRRVGRPSGSTSRARAGSSTRSPGPASAPSSTPPRSAPTAPARRSGGSTSPGRSTASRPPSTRATRRRSKRMLDAFERREPRGAGRPPAPGPDLQARGRERDPPPLRRPLPARLPGPQAADPVDPAGAAAALPGGPLARRRRGLPAGGRPRRPRRLQRRRRAGDRGRGALRALRRPQLPAARAGRCAPPPTSAGSCDCSPPPRAGSTSPSGCRRWTPRGRRSCSAGSRGSPRWKRSRICCAGCATPRVARRRLWSRTRAVRCGLASWRPASGSGS